MKVYYAHCVNIYNTEQERQDIDTLQKLGLEVVNPNNPELEAIYQKMKGLFGFIGAFTKVFLDLVDECDVFAFRALPNGKITSGVVLELEEATEKGKIIIELPTNIKNRSLDKDETLKYLNDKV